MMEINPALLAYQVAVFIIFLFLMYRFVYKRILRVLEERQNKIDEDVTSAEENRQKMVQLREEYQKKMNQVGEESNRIIREAEREANERRNKLMAIAKEDVAVLMERAQRRISEEEEKASAQIRERTVDISLEIVEKILKEKVDAKKDRALVKRFLSEIGDDRWKS